jgi:hypothetical protein
MAISKHRMDMSLHHKKIGSTRSKVPPIYSNQLYEKVIRCNIKSLRFLAQNQIIYYAQHYKYHPHMSIYIYYISLVNLYEKVFRNLNLIHKKKEKSE